MNALRRAFLIAFCLSLVGPSAHGFTMLGFPSDTSVQAGDYKAWQPDADGLVSLSYSMGSVSGGPNGWYVARPDFLPDVPDAGRSAAGALETWAEANPRLRFTQTGYLPVINSHENWVAGGYAWEGPYGAGIGTNVDILSAPPDFSFEDYRGRRHSFGRESLAFAAYVSISSALLSVDVYVRDDWAWRTDGAGSGFDVETVVLHELGHALGLDHPDEADEKGAENYDPRSYEPGYTPTGEEVMLSDYHGVTRELTVDEQGGARFLYPFLTADTDYDGDVDLLDLLAVKVAYGGYEGDAAYSRSADFDADGDVDLLDLLCVKTNYGASAEGLPQLKVSSVPGPGAPVLLAVGALAWLTRRHRRG